MAGRVETPKPPFVTEQAAATLLVLEALAETLRAKGILVHTGWSWDGFCDLRTKDPFWYFYPHDNAGAGVYHEIPRNDGSHEYAAGDIVLPGCLERVEALPSNPDPNDVWDILCPHEVPEPSPRAEPYVSPLSPELAANARRKLREMLRRK